MTYKKVQNYILLQNLDEESIFVEEQSAKFISEDNEIVKEY